ncbi:hypothetical protein M406DRAFT_325018 [Cryphonectria parasitica EP155]|uniref:Uncharacterized protein n=1 Tax=Cryphonectria parasitica (strain ATCC 38755 / EP155) TaxID=660469 RepID=A0A9P4YAL8_CRYP1|nr:uncharacterized protein M406DRAFT_325018 [Cryphonectria parasitica EP155]KAF3769511.1 hypothetical protein M406DRAFT_325018 [Cryphonectria parasitica EP155]
MIIPEICSRANSTPLPADILPIILVFSSIGGLILLASVILVVLRLRNELHLDTSTCQESWINEPGITYNEYERRCRLVSKRLSVEESQRIRIIRKSQQRRLDALSQPPSSTYHGNRNVKTVEKGPQENITIADEKYVSWELAQANVERTWRLHHDRGSRLHQKSTSATIPEQINGTGNDSGDGDISQRPPSVRLKTPPLLSHPLFRDGNERFRSRHLSLPTELTRAKTSPMVPGNSGM